MTTQRQDRSYGAFSIAMRNCYRQTVPTGLFRFGQFLPKTKNVKRKTSNEKRQTKNVKRKTSNEKRQTKNV
ncbi:MAG: hypothetical protein MUD08_16190, partial [Cytophagales bacterium]|nr:hypothetical protein [Cytophagales bacterium]